MNATKWSSRLDKVTYAFVSEFGSLTPAQLNWKPNPQTWSVAQNIRHLILVNETYYPVIQALRKKEYKVSFLGRIGFVVQFFGKAILNAVEPTRKKKMKTMALWQPEASDVPGDIVVRFKIHQKEVERIIGESHDLLRSGTVIASPANSNIVYKLETAFEIMVTHEERHLAQAREILALLPVAVRPSN